jgi:5-formaminoimidazole-4-carboxamide-1-(beta)-D-ribofuranosyl 5'-monophosphate synthetase
MPKTKKSKKPIRKKIVRKTTKRKAVKATTKKSMFKEIFDGVNIEVREVKSKPKREESILPDVFEKLGEIKDKILHIKSDTKISEVLESYDKSQITIGALGGHSALDVCRGAKKHGFRTVVVCQKGRENTYSKYYRTREDGRGIIDEIIVVDKFKDIVKKEVQNKLIELNTIFIHNRYFWVYFDDYKDVEERFKVPIFGTRDMVKLEERDQPKNQYYLMQKANIRIPKIYKNPKDIDQLVIVKVAEAARGYERAFFFCNSPESYKQKSEDMIKNKTITKEALKIAVIEEYIVGAQVNFNYFYSSLTDELELMGTDTRRQTNLDGLLRLPADIQLEVLKYLKPKLVETGHIAVTTKESILEKIFKIGEQFVETCKKEHPPGIIGPFALQGAVASMEGKEELVIFDVSMRIPGSPGTLFTPHTGYLYHDSISYGERIAMEIRKAIDEEKLDLICT